MGSLYKRPSSSKWMMAVMANGKQLCKSTHTPNKRLAQKQLARWETEIFEKRFHLPKSSPPFFEKWADEFIEKIAHPNTRKRYRSSARNLKKHFRMCRLSEISAEHIEAFKDARLAQGLETATVNHDLRVLRRMLRIAERRQLISHNPFVHVDFLRQRTLRLPHIVTFEEEAQILKSAPPHIRVLTILILETGMRSHKEALSLRWDRIDFDRNLIQVQESKTRSGIRNIPLSARCKDELVNWREFLGLGFSPFVFPNLRNPSQSMKDVRESWAKTLREAGIQHFCLYHLRHSHASRLSAAGVSDLFVAQMIGHSSPSILQIYSKAIDEYRRDAIRKLEDLRARSAAQI